jgi:Sec-independent protein translocase protein TatA
VETWEIILIIGIVLILFSLVRRRGGAAKYPEVVQALLYDVKLDQALAEHFLEITKLRRFENVNWLMNKDKIGFLGESLKDMLRETFKLVEEFNQQIKEAQKAKSDSYKTIDLTRFKELLDKCRQELEDWMVQKTGQKELPPKYPTLWGSLFGER